MASEAYEQILIVQDLDLSIRRLQHRHAGHPARQALAEAQVRLGQLDAERSVLDEQRHELERRQKRQQDEAATVQARRDDIEGKLYGGEVTATKELLALQDESAALLDRRRAFEDEELMIMEELETVDADLTELAARRADVAAEADRATTDLNVSLAEIQVEIDDVSERRQEAVAAANPALVDQYDRLKDQFDGVAVARLVDGGCDGCHIKLSAVAVDQMAKMADDAVVTCEECGRLLVR